MQIEGRMKEEKHTSFMKNVLMLMASQVLIKILGFIYRLVIINIEGFGDVGNGYYNSGYQIYSLLLTISSVGIPSVIAKLVSERVAVGDNKGAYRIFKTALKVFTLVGAILSLGLFFGAETIANVVLNVPDVKYVLMVLSPAIMFVAASSVMRGYFSGLGTMKPTSISQTLEQLFNCILTITFVYSLIGKDPAVMAAGGNLSTTLAVIMSFSYLLIFYKKRKKEIALECENQTVEIEDKTTKQIIKTILAISIPMTIGSLISVINSTIDTITISNCVQKAYEGIIVGKEALEAKAMELSGILSKIETIIHLPLAINAAFCTALVPAISTSIAKNDIKNASRRLTFSFFASILIILPCAVGLAVLAKPILLMLYPTASDGAYILAMTTITMVFVALNYVINGGLYGIGKVHIPAIALAVGGVLKLILNIVLISNPNINIFGATISSIVCQGVSFIICYIALRKEIKMEINFKNHILKPAISSIIMGIGAYGTYTLMHNYLGNAISTVVAIFAGILIYVIAILMTRTLSKEDIYMIPYGRKFYDILVKIKLYK